MTQTMNAHMNKIKIKKKDTEMSISELKINKFNHIKMINTYRTDAFTKEKSQTERKNCSAHTYQNIRIPPNSYKKFLQINNQFFSNSFANIHA
jgi:hypothetical protein